MNIHTASEASRPLPAARARIGLIIPAVNTLSEPQFNHFAPEGLGIYVTRARVAGKWRRPVAEMADEVRHTAALLSDMSPDLIVFHCTDSSMQEGPAGETRLLDLIHDETRLPALSTNRLVADALETLGIKSVVVLSPYLSNDNIIRYLTESGIKVVHDVKLGLTPQGFTEVTPQQWADLAREHDRPDADGIFLSCTNTTQIEAIAEIERTLGKPVVNSNQAVLWGCLMRLKDKLPPLKPMPELGRLMQTL
jgi:maleate cis-trans isomerase